jgi:hypothetical protein
MRARLSWCAAVAVCVGLVGAVGAQGSLARHPIVGSWKLNAAKSTVGFTLTIATAPDGAMTMGWSDQKYTFKVDSKEYQVPVDTTATWTQKGANRWETIYKVKGKVDNIDQIALSADGRTLTIDTDRVTTRTKEHVVYARTSGGPGLAGVWKATNIGGDMTLEYAVAGDKLSAHIEPTTERWSGPLDGKDYPATAIPGNPGNVTWAGHQEGPRTIKFLLKRDGKPIQFATLAVSADGKTLEVTQINGATETSQDRNRLIFERR